MGSDYFGSLPAGGRHVAISRAIAGRDRPNLACSTGRHSTRLANDKYLPHLKYLPLPPPPSP
ncbi:hypothetical protein J6590_027928 [Homalodisca vitripennis]|nr:hypothetical protein J6590_027928 [Homalodisca vitripennis]